MARLTEYTSFADAQAHFSAAGRLEDNGIPDLTRRRAHEIGIIAEGSVGAGNAGDACGPHRAFGGDLVPENAHARGGRADEGKPGCLDALRKSGILRQKSVAGMNRFRSADLGCEQNGCLVQVALRGSGRSDAQGLVGEADMRRFAIGLGVNRDRAQPQPAAGALDA